MNRSMGSLATLLVVSSNFSLKFGLMYDRRGLYVGARVVDATPLTNAADPQRNAEDAQRGDSLVLNFISDLSWPGTV